MDFSQSAWIFAANLASLHKIEMFRGDMICASLGSCRSEEKNKKKMSNFNLSSLAFSLSAFASSRQDSVLESTLSLKSSRRLLALLQSPFLFSSISLKNQKPKCCPSTYRTFVCLPLWLCNCHLSLVFM